MNRYSEEHFKWLRDNYPLMSRKDISIKFNDHFSLDYSAKSILSCLKNHKITSGRTGCFKKGDTPWNNGKKGYMGANKTSFKKGNIPHNHRPLYSERVSRDGYIEISVPEKSRSGFHSRFKSKHTWIWEKDNGPVPDGHVVIFKDGDNRNFDNDNLLLVTRTELLVLNSHDYKNQSEEIKPTILALAKLETKASFRVNPGRGRTP